MEVVINEENFESEVLNSDKPVLVDFWATWCGPCRMLAPVLSEIANEKQDSFKVGKVNVDEQIKLADKFKVVSIPMLILFDKGQVVKTLIGYRSKEEIISLLQL